MSTKWGIGNLFAAKGEKTKGHLELPTLNEKLPAFLANGLHEGPTVLVMGGIHGCEYTSIDAALKIGISLDPKYIQGKIIILPIVNISSFYARSIYVHPDDQKNLNRMFPGIQHGTSAERLAYWLNEIVFKKVDYIIDLHGGDMIEALVPFTIYHVTEDKKVLQISKEMASLFDIKYVIGSDGQVPGSTYGCAAEQGIPAIIAEAGQQGILSKEQSLMLQEGVKNILISIHVLKGKVINRNSIYLSVFEWYRSDVQCLWYPEIAIGDQVEKGQLLGRLSDEFGETIREVYSNSTGIVLFLVSSLAINQNDPLLAVGA
ncbi:M14 family metallopeptidase [Planococcus versutus]|uniref:M14 family metallopeptidase n=1 Tax=Planococcus versutus TaxID=1302659 RepID=UPI0006724A6D|nr:M14 family metallopeptidase [Planococcus versutus]